MDYILDECIEAHLQQQRYINQGNPEKDKSSKNVGHVLYKVWM